MPQLKCLESYAEVDETFERGRVYELEESAAALLMRGAPDAWKVVEGEVRVGGPDEHVNYAERDREARGLADARAANRVEQEAAEAEKRATRDREEALRAEEAEEFDRIQRTDQFQIEAREQAPAEPRSEVDEDESDDEDDEMDPLANMTVPQLRDHAHGLGIDLGGRRTRADLVAAIEAGADDAEDD